MPHWVTTSVGARKEPVVLTVVPVVLLSISIHGNPETRVHLLLIQMLHVNVVTVTTTVQCVSIMKQLHR